MIEFKLFKAKWCGQCHVMELKLKKLETEYPNIRFTYHDVDAEEQLAKDYDIMGLPTIIVEKDNKEIDRIIGIKTDNDICKIINNLTSINYENLSSTSNIEGSSE